MGEMPVFVKINTPDEAKEIMDSLREAIIQTRTTLNRIKELSENESDKIEDWKANFELVNERVDDVSELLLGTD